MLRIYFLGIGGTAMANVAAMMRQLGHRVSGSDQAVYPPISAFLQHQDIAYREGFSENHLIQENPDLVVVGNAVSRGNPEVEYLLQNPQIKKVSMPELLSHQVLSKRRNLVVTGTHGKTTTTTLIAFLLEQMQLEPGYLIGGIPVDLEAGFRTGKEGGAFVIEGDEYDSAFFDKRSKFIHYQPEILLINNLEFDHADIFRDLEDVQRSFEHLLRIVPSGGQVIINGDDPRIETLLPQPWLEVTRVGLGDHNDIRIADFEDYSEGSQFALWRGGEALGVFRSGLNGLFNARNAALASVAVDAFTGGGLFEKTFCDCLRSFGGVKRPQERVIDQPRLQVFEDFAHHPSAVLAVLRSLRERFPGFYLIACWEPRSNSAIKNQWTEEWIGALQVADRILIGKIHRFDSSFPEQFLQIPKIIDRLRIIGKKAEAFVTNKALLQDLPSMKKIQNKTVIVFLTNGSFDGIIQKYGSATQ